MQVEESYRDWANRMKAEGESDLLLRLLAKRFGDLSADVVARVRGADRAELERLTDRVLEATSLAEVLR